MKVFWYQFLTVCGAIILVSYFNFVLLMKQNMNFALLKQVKKKYKNFFVL